MEKLRPVLKQIFWISTGLVVLLAVSGWLLATGSLVDQIEKDKTKLDTAAKDAASGEEAPNSVYTSGAKLINQQHQHEFELAEQQLHERQIKYRTYPQSTNFDLLTSNSGARISFGDPIEETVLRNQYAKLYDSHFVEQLRVLDPFIVQDNKGMIAVSVEGITHEDVSKWYYNPPTSSEIWNAQEDLWLLRSLFESISKVNEDSGAERLAKSPVRQLLTLYLRGGSRIAAGAAAGGGFGGGARGGFGARGFGARGGDEDFGDEDFGGGPARGGGGVRGGAAGARSKAGAAFAGSFTNDLVTEEFGPDPSGGMGGRGGFSAFDDDEGDEDFGGGRGGGAAFRGAAAAAAAAGPGAGRYVDEEAEYRTRAFLLHAKIEPEYIPALLTELTNSSFPVEIVRVDTQFTNTGGTRSPGMGRATSYGGGGDEDFDDDGIGGRRGGMGMMMGGRALGGLLGAAGLGLGRAGTGRAGTGRAGLRGGRQGARPARGRRGGGGGGDEDFGGRRGGGGGYLAALANKNYNPNLEAKGHAQYSAAVGDPLLAEVRIAGLLTVYRTKVENKAVEETLEKEVKEAEAAGSEASSEPAGEGGPAGTAGERSSNGQEEDAAADDESSQSPAAAPPGDEEAVNDPPDTETPTDSGEESDPAGE